MKFEEIHDAAAWLATLTEPYRNLSIFFITIFIAFVGYAGYRLTAHLVENTKKKKGKIRKK